MKRFLVLGALAGALAIVPFTHTAFADKGGNRANRRCNALAERNPQRFNFLFDSHGDCVSTLRTRIVERCKARSESPRFPFANVGDCVSWARTR